ncbi:hypothetical protein AWN68_05970 [Roseivirga echinicomitans]|uniref:Uncharacterized protein n=1 Tax=Roseivirga echinicomitans TaxID=296218 RepID=A0A150XCX5_9BACT|nr:hypothetical protein AWN68_05970 [Roseivirga echinicomitans]
MNDYNPFSKDRSVLRFIYFEKLDWWDFITITCYSTLTSLIFWQQDLFTNVKDWGLGYTIGTHLCLYFFNYKSMRKMNVWLIWFAISFIHLYIYIEFSSNAEFQFVRGNGISGLKYTWVLLLLYQLFRYYSLKLMNVEFAALSRSQDALWDERRLNRFDLVCFLIYFPTVILINMLTY